MKQIGNYTPWGPSQTARELAPGITLYTTAGHGGAHVELAEIMRWPQALRDFRTFTGGNWYEEDCDICVVVLARPDLFTLDQVQEAANFARSYCAHYAPAVSKWIDSDERRAVKIRAMLGEPVPA